MPAYIYIVMYRTKDEKNNATAEASLFVGMTYKVLLLNDTRNAKNSYNKNVLYKEYRTTRW
jgi:hypothetical protein